ncbi:MAG: aldo/keto reductase [Acetobacteraceae bacterium]
MDWQRIGDVRLANDLVVRRIGFGGAWLTGPGTYGPPPDLDVARSIIRRAVEAGFQLIDTADCYGAEVSERLIAEALYPYPDGIVISTKGGRIACGNSTWRANGRPDHLRRACEASLRRLRLEAIDLYQLNAVDPDVPLQESLGALVELRRAGKIRNIGVCNLDPEQLAAARRVTRIASVQDRYDLMARSNEAALTLCERNGIAFLAWFPPSNDVAAKPGSVLACLALCYAARPAQIGLAWLIARSPAIAPLPRTVDGAWFEEDLAAFEITLAAEEVRQLSTETRSSAEPA